MNILNAKALNKAARVLRRADKAYDKAWYQERANTGKLDVDRFWSILEVWRTTIIRMEHPRIASRDACDELFRRCICGELEAGGVKVEFDELVRFIENYEAISDALSTALYDIVTDKSDDSYSDLCDSLPLVGRAAVKKMLALAGDGLVHDNGSVIHLIDESVPKNLDDAHRWRDFIWNGENYFRMFLDEVAKERYVREACEHKPREEALV